MCSISVAPIPLIRRSPVAPYQASYVAAGRFSPADTQRRNDETSYGR
jgi:hypothetical protein